MSESGLDKAVEAALIVSPPADPDIRAAVEAAVDMLLSSGEVVLREELEPLIGKYGEAARQYGAGVPGSGLRLRDVEAEIEVALDASHKGEGDG